MLSRRQVARGFTGALLTTQRRYDHDRWYGHALEMDLSAYRYTGEFPPHMKQQRRTADEVKAINEHLPKFVFRTTYECLLWDADRLNPHLNRKEFANETRLRLEKQANIVSRSQTIFKEGKYEQQREVEDSMVARIIDEEHVQAEMKYVKCIRANEMAEDNRLDILPGGSPNSLREKTRWNTNVELHPIDRSEIMDRLMAWLPEKYHIVYQDDFQTVAANDETARKEMLKIIDAVEKEHTAEAKSLGMEQALAEEIQILRDDVDPSRAVTPAAIKACTNLEQLEQWSRLVHEYNGDSRIFDIYARAAELTKNAAHTKLVEELRALYQS
eukprot:PhF_6_TR4926/c0_g1_i1/m.6983